jgi:hypothetical protein
MTRLAASSGLAGPGRYAWRWLSPDTTGAVADGQQDPRPGAPAIPRSQAFAHAPGNARFCMPKVVLRTHMTMPSSEAVR